MMLEKTIQFNNFKFTHLEFKSLNLAIIKRVSIYSRLNKIEKLLLKKNGHSYCSDAIYRCMLDRCILACDNKDYKHGYDLVFKDRYEKMIREYSKGKILAPHDFSIEPFNPLFKIMLNVSEC